MVRVRIRIRIRVRIKIRIRIRIRVRTRARTRWAPECWKGGHRGVCRAAGGEAPLLRALPLVSS